jgi:hypothetical protein
VKEDIRKKEDGKNRGEMCGLQVNKIIVCRNIVQLI